MPCPGGERGGWEGKGTLPIPPVLYKQSRFAATRLHNVSITVLAWLVILLQPSGRAAATSPALLRLACPVPPLRALGSRAGRFPAAIIYVLRRRRSSRLPPRPCPPASYALRPLEEKYAGQRSGVERGNRREMADDCPFAETERVVGNMPWHARFVFQSNLDEVV